MSDVYAEAVFNCQSLPPRFSRLVCAGFIFIKSFWVFCGLGGKCDYRRWRLRLRFIVSVSDSDSCSDCFQNSTFETARSIYLRVYFISYCRV